MMFCLWAFAICLMIFFSWKMTVSALSAQAKSRRNSVHSRIFDHSQLKTYAHRSNPATRSLSMPDVYHGLIREVEIKSLEVCQMIEPQCRLSSQETVSSGLKTNSSSSSIGSSRVEGTLTSASMNNINRLSKMTKSMKSYVIMGSSKRYPEIYQ